MTGKEHAILERMEDKVDQLMASMATGNERARNCERRFTCIEDRQKESAREAKYCSKRLYLLLGGVGLIGALAGPFLAALFRKLLQVL
jgi:hypothetical protein